jgi:hypothetical protein
MENEDCFITHPPTSTRETRSAALEALDELNATLPILFGPEKYQALIRLVSQIEAEVLALSH